MGIIPISGLDRPHLSADFFGAALPITLAGFSPPNTLETPSGSPLTVDGLDRPVPESVLPILRFRSFNTFKTELEGPRYNESATDHGFKLCVESPIDITDLDGRTSPVLPTTHEVTASVRPPVQEFIKRVIVPTLVQRFIEGQNRGTLPPRTGETS